MNRRRIAIAAALAAAVLTLLLQPGANAAGLLPPILGGSPSPTPTPEPTQTSSPTPKPKPKATSSSSSSSTRRGPAPTPALRSGVSYVLDIAGTARNTQHLLDLLARLAPAGTTLSTPELARGFGRFPVVGYVWYHNDYGAPRYVPYFHLHEGVDLFAQAGTPVIACVDGVVSKLANGSIGGISFWLDGDDGITYYYGHLSRFAQGLAAGQRVRVGQILGYVGDTGVAKGTYPHLHFEMHPGSGAPVTPKFVLDSWLNWAEAGAVNAYRRLVEFNQLNRIGGARWQSIFDLLREPAAPVPTLWPMALNPGGASFGVDLAFDRIAWAIDPAALTATGFGDPVAAAVAASMWEGPSLLASPNGGSVSAFGAADAH